MARKKKGDIAAVIHNAQLMAEEIGERADEILAREGAEGGSFTRSMALGLAFIVSCPSNAQAAQLIRELLEDIDRMPKGAAA